tara:strand:- start:2981 stop:3463 length:483 start_codon:yes stop_codon:yes gene_type:complete
MAYKQSPGRQMMPKTGKGIPSPLLQEDPELTIKGKALANKMGENLGKPTYASSQGLTKDPTSGKLSANKYEKSLVSGSDLGLKGDKNTYMVDGEKKILKKAMANNPKEVAALKKEYNKMKADTESRRGRNANTLNVFSGKKKDLTEKDINMQTNIGNMKK